MRRRMTGQIFTPLLSAAAVGAFLGVFFGATLPGLSQERAATGVNNNFSAFSRSQTADESAVGTSAQRFTASVSLGSGNPGGFQNYAPPTHAPSASKSAPAVSSSPKLLSEAEKKVETWTQTRQNESSENRSNVAEPIDFSRFATVPSGTLLPNPDSIRRKKQINTIPNEPEPQTAASSVFNRPENLLPQNFASLAAVPVETAPAVSTVSAVPNAAFNTATNTASQTPLRSAAESLQPALLPAEPSTPAPTFSLPETPTFPASAQPDVLEAIPTVTAAPVIEVSAANDSAASTNNSPLPEYPTPLPAEPPLFPAIRPNSASAADPPTEMPAPQADEPAFAQSQPIPSPPLNSASSTSAPIPDRPTPSALPVSPSAPSPEPAFAQSQPISSPPSISANSTPAPIPDHPILHVAQQPQQPAPQSQPVPQPTPQSQSAQQPAPQSQPVPQPQAPQPQAQQPQTPPVSASGIVPPPEGFAISSEEESLLNQFLLKWERFGKDIKKVACEVHVKEHDGGLYMPNRKTPLSHTWGKFRFIAPNKLSYHVEGEFVYKPGASSNDDPKPEYEKGRNELKFVCDGKSWTEYDFRNRVATTYPIPEDQWNQDLTMDGPFPLFFIANAENLKKRFYLRLVTPKERLATEVWIEAWPRQAADAGSFQKILVALRLSDLQPYYLRKYHVNGKSYSDLSFQNISVNKGFWSIDSGVDFGWKKEVKNEPFAIVPAAPQPAAPTQGLLPDPQSGVLPDEPRGAAPDLR